MEFDTFFNFGVDPSGNHVGVDLGGNAASVATAEAAFTLEEGGDLTAFIDYNGASGLLEVRLARGALRPAAALLSYTVDLAAAIGQPDAFVGFTSATGAAFANHDIVNWQFRDNFSPIDNPTEPPAVPEPATWATMMLGFGLAGGAVRRRRRAVPA